jgi:excisionase family DNA binding protein
MTNKSDKQNKQMTDRKFLDINMASDYLHLSKSSIYKMVSGKTIPHRKIGTRTLFVVEEIDNWVLNNGRMEDDLPSLPKF